DDEAAFRLADLENRARRDVSDIERARNYALALASHYAGRQKRMAELLRVAAIPDAILAAFASLDELGLKPAYGLAQALGDRTAARRIEARARGLATEQAARQAAGTPPLLAAASPPAEAAPLGDLAYVSRHGRPALSVQSINRQGVTLRLHAGAGAG